MTADNPAVCEIAGGHRPPLQLPFSTFCAKPAAASQGETFSARVTGQEGYGAVAPLVVTQNGDAEDFCQVLQA